MTKWRPLDARAEARLRILEPDYLPPPEQAPPPHPVEPPRRGFGRRGL